MPDSPPVFYHFFGNDEFGMEQSVQLLKARLGDSTAVELNFTTFQAGNFSLDELEQACLSTPFLASRRLVVLADFQQAPKGDSFGGFFLQLLDRLPDTSALICLEWMAPKDSRDETRLLEKSLAHQWVQRNPDRSFSRKFMQPKGAEFVRWLRNRCVEIGGEIQLEAAELLAELVDYDSLLCESELQKLTTYTFAERAITPEDVEKLTPIYGQTDVFSMVDAIGQRNPQRALGLLQQLLQERDVRYVQSMIIRQFRLLLQARDAIESGRNPLDALPLPDFIGRKIASQANNFQSRDLEWIYHRLLQIDWDSKRGAGDLETELTQLSATLTL